MKIFFQPDVSIKLLPHSQVAEEYWTHTRFEFNELKWILQNFNSKGTFIDIGANVGLFALTVAKFFPNSKVYALEPSSSSYQKLIANIRLNELDNIVANCLALGHYRGEAVLLVNIEGRNGLNTLGRYASHPDARITDHETVPIVTLHEYIAKQRIEHIDMMKVDVEGAELMVFKGAAKLLNSSSAPIILFEFPRSTANGFGYEPEECLDFLHECGYQLYNLGRNGRIYPIKSNFNVCSTIIAKK